MKTLVTLTLTAMVFAVFASRAAESDSSLPVVKPKVKTVAAFKNGIGFVVKAGETPLKDGWACMEQLPPAALGSLWIGTTSKAGPITDILAYREKISEELEAITLSEMLAANVGRRVILTYVAGTEARVVEGDLLAVPEDRKPDGATIVASSPSPHYGSYIPPGPQPARAEIVLLRTTTADGRASLLSLAKGSVVSLEVVGDAQMRTKVEKEVARTKIRVGGGIPGVRRSPWPVWKKGLFGARVTA